MKKKKKISIKASYFRNPSVNKIIRDLPFAIILRGVL